MTSSGFVHQIANLSLYLANEVTYPVLVFFSAGIVNIFVPSGGGQIALMGPVVLEGSKLMSSRFDLAFMALCYGDQWTNMLQPFWALPLLGLTGLRARDLLGYTIVIMLLSGIAIITILLVFSMF